MHARPRDSSLLFPLRVPLFNYARLEKGWYTVVLGTVCFQYLIVHFSLSFFLPYIPPATGTALNSSAPSHSVVRHDTTRQKRSEGTVRDSD